MYNNAIPNGLSDEEVTVLHSQGQVNIPFVAPTKKTGEIFIDNIFTLFNFIHFFLASAIILVAIIYAEPKLLSNLAFMGVIFSNTAIGIIQEIKSKKTIDKLSLLIQPNIAIMRNGKEISLTADELVRGDIMVLRSGNQPVVDGEIVKATDFSVNESLLTGEADPVNKNIGDTVFSGSFITGGIAYVRISKISAETYVAKLSQIITDNIKPQSVIVASMNKLIKILTMIIIPLGILLLGSKIFFAATSLNWQNLTVSTSAAMIGMIPQGLILMSSIAFAAGVIKLGKHNVLLKTLPAVETLARVDVVCLDKTGTITTGNLLWTSTVFPQLPCRESPTFFSEKQSKFLPATILHQIDTNSTALALKLPYQNLSKDSFPLPERIISFNSQRKWSGAIFGNKLYLFGAPEFILTDLKSSHPQLAAQINTFTANGMRILLFAEIDGLAIHENNSAEINLSEFSTDNILPLALLVLTDEIRQESLTTFNYLQKQNVQLKLISGDNPVTVSAVAKQIDFPDADKWLDLSGLSPDADLGKLSEDYAIFARVTPEQKQLLVSCLQKNGHTVAMTGDGVNDVPALKVADCGIAMASGSDACKAAADIVLLDNNFNSFIPAIQEGRQIINNLEKVGSLFLTKTTYSCLLALIFIFLPLTFPIYPIQFTLISSLTIGIPAFFLALQPNRNLVKGKFLEKILRPALPLGLASATIVLIIAICARYFHLTYAFSSALTTICLLLSGFIALWQACRPWNLFKISLFGISVMLFVLATIFLPRLFLLNSLYTWQTLYFLPLLLLYYPLIFLFRRLL